MPPVPLQRRGVSGGCSRPRSAVGVGLAVLLVLFGAKRLPELARSLGKSVKELQRGLDDDTSDASEDVKEAEDTPPGS